MKWRGRSLRALFFSHCKHRHFRLSPGILKCNVSTLIQHKYALDADNKGIRLAKNSAILLEHTQPEINQFTCYRDATTL